MAGERRQEMLNRAQEGFRRKLKISMISLVALVFGVLCFGVVRVLAQGAEAARATNPSVMGWGFLAAALSTGLGSIAAGIAVGYVGASAMGVIGEKPELAGRALIFVGLAEGIAIYGLIIAIMILGRI